MSEGGAAADGHRVLDETSLAEGVAVLRERDPLLAGVIERFGPPPLWAREPGFATLLLLILEQQVSLASARAAFARLREAAPVLTPETFLALDDQELRRIGFSRQKSRYGRLLAGALAEGSFDLDALEDMSDGDAHQALVGMTGIGPWTADTYLLMAMRRSDVWPAGDVALQAAYQDLEGLEVRPTIEEMVTRAEVWRPWRAVAARILWFHYLGGVA